MSAGIGQSVAAHLASSAPCRGPGRFPSELRALAVAVLVASGLAGAVELALRAFGCGYPTTYFLPSEDGRYLRSNRQFGWRFFPHQSAIVPNPVWILAAKPTDVTRIVLLGESAAAGTPDPAFGFGRMLEIMLTEEYPARRFEVINTAMRGVDSHVILSIARDCARLQPDLFIIYAGNNEFVRLQAPASDTFPAAPNRRFLRIRQALLTSRMVQAIDQWAGGRWPARLGPPARWDMEFFRQRRLGVDDPQRAIVCANFRANLADLLEVTRGTGAPVIVSTVAVNERDCPPLGSLHRRGLSRAEQAAWATAYARAISEEAAHREPSAIGFYEQTDRLDPGFAETHFRLARCLEDCGRFREARREFGQARDCDALAFRADSRINQIIRQTAGGRTGDGIELVDLDQALVDGAGGEQAVPGEDLFRDHVHFTFDGDYAVAERLLPRVVAALGLGEPAGPLLTREACARRLAYGPCVEADLDEPIVTLTGSPPFLDQLEHRVRQACAEARLGRLRRSLQAEDWARAIASYGQAIGPRSDDWQLHYDFARLLRRAGKPDQAIAQFECTLRLFPRLVPAMVGLGYALLDTGRREAAASCFKTAVRIDPHSRMVRQALASLLARNTEGTGPGG